jgi:hypothetical protein
MSYVGVRYMAALCVSRALAPGSKRMCQAQSERVACRCCNAASVSASLWNANQTVIRLLTKRRVGRWQLMGNKDEVGARGVLESSMAVALLLMDAETIYNIANLFLAANSPSQVRHSV